MAARASDTGLRPNVRVRHLLLIAACLTTGVAGSLTAHETDAHPATDAPMIGLDGPDLDACGGIGSIKRLEPDLAVFERPEDYAREKDRLPAGTLVWLCQGRGAWQGVVYATGEFQDLGDCRVSSPIATPRVYDGPCASGWVVASSINLVAG